MNRIIMFSTRVIRSSYRFFKIIMLTTALSRINKLNIRYLIKFKKDTPNIYISQSPEKINHTNAYTSYSKHFV